MDIGARPMNQFGALNGEFLALHPSQGIAPASRITSGGLTLWQAKRALEHIEVNLGSKLEVHDLAQMIGRSGSHFAKAFTRSFGLPPMKYLATRRIERAKAMMASTSEQLSEIALACGFADQSHLNRHFQRVVGTSPGRWRRTMKQARGCHEATAASRGVLFSFASEGVKIGDPWVPTRE